MSDQERGENRRSNEGNNSNTGSRGLASADPETREMVARAGGEASRGGSSGRMEGNSSSDREEGTGGQGGGRGFASMDEEKRREAASRGGKSSQGGGRRRND